MGTDRDSSFSLSAFACTVVAILYGYCGPSHGQGSWRGIPDSCLEHWFTTYSTFSHIPGCPQCSDGHRWRCRRWPSEHAEHVSRDRHTRSPHWFLRWWHSLGPTECHHRKNQCGERVWRSQETSVSENDRFVTLLDHSYLAFGTSHYR